MSGRFVYQTTTFFVDREHDGRYYISAHDGDTWWEIDLGSRVNDVPKRIRAASEQGHFGEVACNALIESWKEMPK